MKGSRAHLVAAGGLALASGFSVVVMVVNVIGTGGSIWSLAPGSAPDKA